MNHLTNTRYGMMLVPETDQIIGRSLSLYGEWYQAEMDLLQSYIPENGLCIDAGANLGCHTLFFSRAVGALGCVFAFEPQRILFQILCANIALNDALNVQAIHAALGKESGSTVLPAIDYHQPGNFGAIGIGGSGGEGVQLRHLDEYSFPRVDLIKIDVEGSEPQVLLGAEKTIQTHRPILYIEYHPKNHTFDLLSYLRALGYAIHEHLVPGYNPKNFKGETKNIHGAFQESNLFCAPLEKNMTVSLSKFL